MTNQTMPAMAPRPIVSIVAQSVRALSTDVAAFFGKEHKNVIRDIRNLIESEPSLNGLNFEPISFHDSYGRVQPAFSMDRTGFSLLAMGFTGEKALKFKLAYIRQFEAMEAQLKGISYTLTPAQQAEVQSLVKQKAKTVSSNYQRIYGMVKNYFKVGKYNQIPASRFEELIEYIKSIEVVEVPQITVDQSELQSISNMAYYFLLTKPVLLNLYNTLSRLQSPIAPRLYSLATEPVPCLMHTKKFLLRHGIDVESQIKQLK